MRESIFFAVFAALLLQGCLSTSTGGLEVSLKEGESRAAIRVDDNFFSQHVDVEEAAARRAASGFLESRVLVRNRLDKDFPIQYKFVWLDRDGIEIQPDGRPWEQRVLHGGEAAALMSTAPQQGCVRFVVRVRRVR